MRRKRLLLSHIVGVCVCVRSHIMWVDWQPNDECRDRYKMMITMNCVMFEQIIALTLHLSLWVDGHHRHWIIKAHKILIASVNDNDGGSALKRILQEITRTQSTGNRERKMMK